MDNRVNVEQLLAFILTHTGCDEHIQPKHIELGLKEQGLELLDGKIGYIMPLFKYDDLISNGKDTVRIYDVRSTHYITCAPDDDYVHDCKTLSLGHQDEWHRVYRKPDFKVGDVIYHRCTPFQRETILEIEDKNERYKIGESVYLRFASQKHWSKH